MFLIGIASLIQCWFLPGLLVLYKLKKLNFIDKLILSLPISIIIKYFLAILLIILNLFNQNLLILIFGFELILFFYYYKNNFFKIFETKIPSLNFNLLNLLNTFLIFIFLYLAIKSIGKVIYPGDPYVMWNSWAIDIFENKFPTNSRDYPLGYPILQAISYKMINTYEIEFFAQAVQIIFPLFSIITLMRIITLSEIKVFNYVLLFFLILILNQFRHTLYIGFVDTVLVFCSTILIYLIYLIRNSKDLLTDSYFLFVLVLVLSVSGIIKQTGLYISLISPLVIFLSLNLKFEKFQIYKFISLFFLICLIILWYIYKLNFFINDVDSPNALNLINLHEGKSFLEKILRTSKLIFNFGLIIIIPSFIISVIKKDSRIFLFLVILPYFFIWSFLYGNDARNFALILPFIAYVLAQSLSVLQKYLFDKINLNLEKIIPSLIILLLIIGINHKRDYEYMFEKNKIQINTRTLNKEINILVTNYKKIIKII